METIITASYKNFKKPVPLLSPPKEPRRPWWNSDCKTAVKNVKEAEREWRCSPLLSDKRAAWKKADEGIKKDSSSQQKKHDWESFISNLNHQDDQRTTWSFMRAMSGS